VYGCLLSKHDPKLDGVVEYLLRSQLFAGQIRLWAFMRADAASCALSEFPSPLTSLVVTAVLCRTPAFRKPKMRTAVIYESQTYLRLARAFFLILSRPAMWT
jgi:hypothetical protein